MDSKPSFDITSKVADLIISAAFGKITEKAKRNDKIIQILSQVGLSLDSPPANDFDGVYAYTLAVYGIDKPKPLIEFFRHQFIKDAFRQSFETRDTSYLEEESKNFIDWNPIAKKLLSSDYDPRREIAEFQEQFITAAKLTRTVQEVLVDQTLEDISEDIQELPTLDDLQTELSPISQNLEKLTAKEKRLDGKQLKAIANESLNRHRARFSFHKDDEKAWEISRDIHATIVESLLQSPKPIIGIMGPSGTGKSTLLRQIGHDINNNNRGIALWIPAEDILSVTSIDELLHNVLHRNNVSLNNNVSFDALELASRTDIGLLLLVDDVNRAAKPDQILSSISALSANVVAKGTTIHFVVPLWQGQIAVSPDSRETEKHWEIINLGHFSEAESKEYSRLASPQKISNMQQLISSLGGDPFLIGLATEELEEISSKETIDLLREIFIYTIDDAIKKARETSNAPATTKDFNDAIDFLVELMLMAETPEPSWESIKEYLGTEKSKLIFVLAQVNRLGWIDISNGNEVWRWKHTRLRDVIIGRWLAKNVLSSFDVNNSSPANNSLMTDPGLAESFALSFIFLPENIREKAIVPLCKYQHLSLVEILQLNLFSRNHKLGTIIAKTLNQILMKYDGKTREFVDSPESVILYKLSWITNPLVLDVTDGLPKNWSWSVARLRNGDLTSGMLAVANHARNYEFLMGRFPFLEQAITDFGQINYDNKTEVIDSLVKDLSEPKRVNAVFYLASILKWPELVEPLWGAWVNLSQDSKLNSLAGVVWFLSIYDDTSIASKLESALLMSLEISDVPKKEEMGSERSHSFSQPLRLALSQPISSTAAHVWAKTISENQELSNSIGYLLGGIDFPETLDVYIHLSRRGVISMWHETFESIDPLAERLRDENRIRSEKTRNKLWNIVLRESNDEYKRRALGFLSKTIKLSDLSILQSIPLDDPIFENVLRLRLRLKDKTTSSMLIERINKDPNQWIRFAPLIPYEPGVFNAVLDNLEKIPPEHGLYMVDSIFYRLPKEQVKQVVLAKEKLLINSHEAWPSLWLSNEDNALKLVIKAVKQVKQDEMGKIEHFFTTAGMPPPTTITQKMLDALVPILDYFPNDSLRWLAEISLRSGFEKWAIENLGEILKDVKWRTFEWFYTENIIATLSEAAQYVDKGFDMVVNNSSLYGLEYSYQDRSAYMTNPVDAVKIWLKNSFTSNNFIISARIISKFGSGDDIDWWLSQKPSDDNLISVWEHTLYHLKRRRWQNTA